jgi:hypothetical protein
MVPGMEHVRPPVGMMDNADGVAVFWMRVPVQAPAPLDVAVVRSPEDTDGREDRDKNPGVEDPGVEPVPGSAGVQPFQGEEPRKHEHQPSEPAMTCRPVFRGRAGRMGNVVTTPQRSPRGSTRASVRRAIGCGFHARRQGGRPRPPLAR